nr:MAG TPA: hypothetical protein [Caudoviricetes sp.]
MNDNFLTWHIKIDSSRFYLINYRESRERKWNML